MYCFGISFLGCQAQFDFTEHTLEDCDGKCWKSVDLIDLKHLGNNSMERYKLKDAALSSLKSSRRCFSVAELVQTADMEITTSDGCRIIKRENKKSVEMCFCSDQDMCNGLTQLTLNFFIYSSTVSFVLMVRL